MYLDRYQQNLYIICCATVHKVTFLDLKINSSNDKSINADIV